jgi:subtilase family serine protease
MPKNVSLWVGHAQKVGVAADTAPVHVTLFLSFRNQDALKDLIKAQYTRGNPQYGKYLSPEDFRSRFAPDPAKVSMVQDTLTKLGFKIENTPKSGLFVEASGTVALVKSAFGVSQGLYAYKGKVLRANVESPRLPARIADIVTYVAGLDETHLLRRPMHVNAREEAGMSLKPAMESDLGGKPVENAPPPVQTGIDSPFCSTYWGDHTATLSTAPGPYPATLPWLICGYTPQQVRQAYGADKVSETGAGVRVGIVDLYASPTIVQDTNRYSRNHGLPKLTYTNFKEIIPPGILNVPASDPCGPQGWYEEESLDVQSVHSMAPGAFILYGGIACTDPGNTALYLMIDDHLTDIVTNSYSFNGENLPADFIAAEDQFFMQADAEGMSILFSSGDDGDLAASNGIASGTWEATSPYVTAVGGTSLALTSSSGAKSEWGWGDYRVFLNDATVSSDGASITTTGITPPYAFYSGAGGGPSLSQLAPDYQANVPYGFSGYTTLANGSYVWLQTPHRVTPDIAMLADPYTGFLYGETFTISGVAAQDAPCKPLTATTEYCEGDIGGTSLSSPTFAGVLALVNEARFSQGLPAIGFANPTLYSLPVGPAGTKGEPIIDVKPPKTPTALLRGYVTDFNKVRVVTMNSYGNFTDTKAKEGYDTSYKTGLGYDEVTGLGTPNIPALIYALTNH